jgi:hypothetical protein
MSRKILSMPQLTAGCTDNSSLKVDNLGNILKNIGGKKNWGKKIYMYS